MYSRGRLSNNYIKSPILLKNIEKKFEKTYTNITKLIQNLPNSKSEKSKNLKNKLSPPKTVYNKEFRLFDNKPEEEYSSIPLISHMTIYNKKSKDLNKKIEVRKEEIDNFSIDYKRIKESQKKKINKDKFIAFKEMEERYISQRYKIPKNLYLKNLFSSNPLLFDKTKEIEYYYESKLFEKRNNKKVNLDNAEKFLNHSYEQINGKLLQKISLYYPKKNEGFKSYLKKRKKIGREERNKNAKEIKQNIHDIKKTMESLYQLENTQFIKKKDYEILSPKIINMENKKNNPSNNSLSHSHKSKNINNEIKDFLDYKLKIKKIFKKKNKEENKKFYSDIKSDLSDLNNKSKLNNLEIKNISEKETKNILNLNLNSPKNIINSYSFSDIKKLKTPKLIYRKRNNKFINFNENSNKKNLKKYINKTILKEKEREKNYKEIEKTYQDITKTPNHIKDIELKMRLTNFFLKRNSSESTISYSSKNIHTNLLNLKKRIQGINLINTLSKFHNNRIPNKIKKIIENEERLDDTLINFDDNYIKCLLDNKSDIKNVNKY